MTDKKRLTDEEFKKLKDDTLRDLGALAAKFVAYKVYRRIGAPGWAAFFMVETFSRLGDIREGVEHIEQHVCAHVAAAAQAQEQRSPDGV